jgi:hypothetical protein
VVLLTVIPTPNVTVAPDWRLAPLIVTPSVVFTLPTAGVIVPMNGVSGKRVASACRSRIRGFVTGSAPRVSVIGTPLAWSAARIWSTVASGRAALRRAKPPATCGAAIDVPLNSAKSPLGIDETIESPGANSERNVATLEK